MTFKAWPLFKLRLPGGVWYAVDTFDDGSVYDAWGASFSKALTAGFLRFTEAVGK
jgi:hypothetical protein